MTFAALRRLLALAAPAALLAQSPTFPDPKPAPALSCAATSFTYGRCQFSLGAGTILPLQADGRTVGFYYQGSGSFSYRSEEAVEHTVMAYNLEHNTKLKPTKGDKGLTLNSGFTHARFWFGHGTLPVTGAPVASGDEVATVTITDYAAWAERWKGIRATTPEDAIALALANPTKDPYIRAELAGGPEDFLYELDPLVDRTESLSLLRKLTHPADKEMAKWFIAVPLSAQPFGWDIHQPQPNAYILTAVDVAFESADTYHATLVANERILPLVPLKALQFNLQDRILEPDGATGVKHHFERLKRVTTAAGVELPFHHAQGTVTVLLPETAQARQPLDLRFEIEGDFLVHPDGDNFFELNIGEDWYPRPGLSGLSHTFHAVMKVKKPWQAFASGDTVRRTTEGDYTVVETLTDKPIAWGTIIAGDYQIQEETRNGRTVRVATYALKAGNTKQLADMAFNVLKYYEGFMGAYPFKEFQIIQKNEWGYGQAPAGIMFITKEAFNQTMDEFTQAVAVDVRHRFVHEIAHQWWGTLVKMPSMEEQWLTESFADICAGLCIEDWKGKSYYAKQVGPWKSGGKEASPFATIPTANRLRNSEFPTEARRARQGLIYDKGAYLLHCIRKEIGDDLFFKFLKSYQASFKWRFGTTRDVAGLLKVITGKDWQPWFEKYYWGTEFPTIKE